MTIRRMHTRAVWFLVGLTIALIAILIGYNYHFRGPRHHWSYHIVYRALNLAYFVAFGARLAALRCPRCRGKLYRLQSLWPWRHPVPPFCQSCGLGWDDELPAEPPVETPDRPKSSMP